MSRTKSTAQKKSVEAEIIDVEAKPVEPEKPIVALEKHLVTREYKRRVPVTPDGELIEPEAEDFDEDGDPEIVEIETEDDAAEIEEEELSAQEAWMRDMGVTPGDDWTITVERLPRFHIDGRVDLQCKSDFCGTIPFTQNFREEIQARWAREGKCNDFRIRVRKNNRYVKKGLFQITIEPLTPDALKQKQLENPQTVIPMMMQQGDSVKDYVSQMKSLAQLRESLMSPVEKMMLESLTRLQVQQIRSGFNGEPQAVPLPPRELSPMEALLKVAETDPDLLERATSKVRGLFTGDASIAPERGILEIVVQALAPAVTELVKRLPIGNLPTAPEPQQLPAESHPQTLPLPEPLQLLLQSLAQNRPAPEIAQTIKEQMVLHPEFAPVVQQYLMGEPHTLLIALARLAPDQADMLALPHTYTLLCDVFDALNVEEEEE